MTHEEKVEHVCEQMRSIAKGLGSIKIDKGSVSHFVPNPREKTSGHKKVDTSPLNEIISIDAKTKTCVAEPGVSFSALVKETLRQGLIPHTVPELKGITIGGAISGCSVESMSYKYGGFHDSCTEYEVVTGAGDVITCSRNLNTDIFHMIHGSYGTLGIITKSKFLLLDAKPYVKMEYAKFNTFREFWNFLKSACESRSHDFIDAIIHSPDEFVVCMGNLVSNAPYTSSYDWLKIFYKSTRALKEDFLATYDYFFRYDTECHWLTKTVPLMETVPARFLFGKFLLGSTNLIKWSKRLGVVMGLKRRPEVVVDVFIPEKNFEQFFSWYKNDFQFYPLWIVPYRAPEVYPWINRDYSARMGGSFFIDCAVYGKKNSERNKDYSEILERKTVELNGIKTLISRNHFDETTFWKLYDRDNFRSVKRRTDPDNVFSDLYEKFHKS